MIRDFQEGRRPRANAVASLINTGHVSPLCRRPGVGFAAHANHPGPASRPGPQPMSARQVMAVNAQNSRAKREIEQSAAECQRAVQLSNSQAHRRAASLAFNRIDFDQRAAGRDATTEVVQEPGTYHQLDVTRYAAGGLWIFAITLHDGWGDHQYFVFNPETGALLHFVPEDALRGSQHTYVSKRAQIQGVAAGTGVAGGYLEKGFLGTSALFLTGGAAAELGAYAFVTEDVAPVVSRLAVQAYRVAQPAVQAYARRAAKGALARMGVDAGIQFAAGFATGHGSALERGEQAAQGVNGTSLLVSGIVNTEGLDLSKLGKWLVAGSSAVASNLVTLSAENMKKYKGGPFHMVDFHDAQQVDGFAFNVVLGMLLDRGREGLVEKGTEKILEKAAHASGRAHQAATRWVSATRVSLGLSLNLGSGFESGKKKLEHLWEEHNDRIHEEEAEKLARTRLPERSAAHAQPRPHTEPK